MTWRAHLTYHGESVPDSLSFQLGEPSEIGLFADGAHNIDWILLKRERNGVTEQMACTSRQAALIRHINTMPANLLRAYLIDLLTDAPDGEIAKFIVAFRAQNVVRSKP